MTKYVPPISRRNYGRSHGYVDGNGQKMPGVTTILGDGLPKKALINWAANATAEYAVDNWEELSGMSMTERLKKLQGGRYGVTDKAKRRGTEVHGFGERLVKGEAVKNVPAELRGHVEAYTRFLDAFQVDPVAVEFTVASYRFGYAGTGDLIADLVDPADPDGDPVRWLLDLKTNEKGIYGETALQLAAYRYADVIVVDGEEKPMIPVERTGAIHITASSAELIPTVSGEQQLKDFRYAQQIKRWDSESRELILAAVEPPETTRMVAKVDWAEVQA